MATVNTLGTTLSYGTDGVAWTAIGRVISVDPPKLTIGKIAKGVDANNVRQHMPGTARLIEDIRATVEFDKTEHAALLALIGATRHWKIEYSNGSNEKWQGFLNSIGATSVNASEDGVLQAEIAITPTTAITFTA